MSTRYDRMEPSLIVHSDGRWICFLFDGCMDVNSTPIHTSSLGLHPSPGGGEVVAAAPPRPKGRRDAAITLDEIMFLAWFHGVPVTYAIF